MSKYYKADDVLAFLSLHCPKDMWEYQIADLPTIEVSEDCISRKWLEENAKEFGDYYENTVWAVPLSVLTDAPSVVPKTQIETQNSNEDAISREWLISFIDAGHLRNPNELCYSERGVVELIKHAPSVVPKPKEGEWIIHKINGIPHTVECSRCHQHYDYEELRHLGRSKGCIDIPHCPNCGAHLKGEEE